MRAVVVRAFGGPEVLELHEIEQPEPIPTEVLVKVRAAAVNPVETVIRTGAFPLLGEPPFILGWDVSGVVVEVVPGVTRFRPGDEVFGMPMFPRAANAYAEYVAAPSRHFAMKPAALDHVHAAGVPLAGLTAWQALVDTVALEPGQRILINGAAGGVGHLAIQIAKHLGAFVIGSASQAGHEFCHELGADQMIDYRFADFADIAKEVDVVFDMIGGATVEQSLRVLAPGGLLMSAVGRGDAALAARAQRQGLRFSGISVEPDHVGLAALAALADTGELWPHVAHVLPLADVARAHELVETGHVRGKIVLVP